MTKHVNRTVGRKLRQQGCTGKAAEQDKTNGFVHCVFKGNGKSYQVSVQSRKPPMAKARKPGSGKVNLRSDRLQQPKIASRLMRVPGDLLAQRFHRRKLDLGPQPLQENQFQLRLRQQLDRRSEEHTSELQSPMYL